MSSRRLALEQASRDRASRGFEAAIMNTFARYARRKLRQARPRIADRFGKTYGDDPESVFEDELAALWRRYGLAEYQAAGSEAARRAGVSHWLVPRELYDGLNEAIGSKVKLLVKDTEDMVRESIRRTFEDSMAEVPVPSAGEIARRLARQWMGPPSERVPARGSVLEGLHTADWRRSQEEIDAGGREHLFSFTRASTIARTEMGILRTRGTADAYSDIGIEKVSWLAYGDDGRSGEREHWRMNKHPAILVSDMNGSDSSKWFELPSGIRTPYPQWSGLPASEVVNCRCMLIPE